MLRPVSMRRLMRLKPSLDALVEEFSDPRHVENDPIRFVRPFGDPSDREVAGLVAAMLAYGGLKVILASVAAALRPMGDHPAAWLDARPAREELDGVWPGFRHRWTRPHHLADLLWSARETRARHGSLDAAFARARRRARNVQDAAAAWVNELTGFTPALRDGRFLPDPARGSACKRLMLYFRWMTRQDGIDPGGWHSLRPSELILPLDVHTFRAARRLRLTRRTTPDFTAAIEATASLAVICPHDPVRYDFALSHAGPIAPVLRLTTPGLRHLTRISVV
jgi:uncharacterized protein (TIGR02757 family)